MEKNYEEMVKLLESIVDIELEGKWIVFTYKDDPQRGNFDIIEDRIGIKKTPYETIEENDGTILNQVVMLKFNTEIIDVNFVEKIYDHHIDLVVRKMQNNLADALLQTFNYFANQIKEKAKNKIWGDIGEAIFILKTHEYTGVNVINKIHNIDETLYDFSFKNQKYMEIKTTSLDKNEVILSNCQIDYVNNRDFIVVKFKVIENATSIIDIYNLIKEKVGPIIGTTLEENYDAYECCELLNQLTVNLDKVQIWKLSDKCVPQVKVENGSSLKKSKFYLDVTGGLESFENYIKTQDLS